MSILILREAIFVLNIDLNYSENVKKTGGYNNDKSINTWC